jgi:hypothetical protein
MSAPPASSQDACVARRLWKVTFWSSVATLTARFQYLVRKLFRDSAVAGFRGEEQVGVAAVVVEHVLAQQLARGLVNADGALFVVFRVVLDEAAFTGGGVLLRDLDQHPPHDHCPRG